MALLLCAGSVAGAQEVLLPLQSGPVRGSSAKAGGDTLQMPFFDDFARKAAFPSAARWLDGGATVADGVRLLPPTVGVATLDAVDAEGRLYAAADAGPSPADTLCSKPIALGGSTVADSIVLSFYYLPGGGKGDLWQRVGDAPEAADSLMLDFYRTEDSTWVTVWSRGGVGVDSLLDETGWEWQYVAIAITDSTFLNDGFAFRFRNICSVTSSTKPGMAGNCDYWHLDYIMLDDGRSSAGVPEFHDVAFVETAPSMLTNYRAMPARQYRNDEMVPELGMTIVNLFGSTLTTQYGYAVIDDSGDTLYHYDGGFENAPPFLPDGNFQEAPVHAAPPVGFSFPEGTEMREYEVVHVVREGVDGDDHGDNDTVSFRQVFANYYAYDDGTAENGYGLTSTASKVYLAYRFDLNVEDTLTAVDMVFNRSIGDENEVVPFNITVWRSDDEGNPREVVYRDQTSRHPEFDGIDCYVRYVLEHPVVVNGSVFVGFEQGNNYFINLGFDRSIDVSDRIYYLTGTAWQRSILSGALMMRPYFGVGATVGIADAAETREWNLYPNPADAYVRIDGCEGTVAVCVYDMAGRQVAMAHEGIIETKGLPAGVYVVRCVDRQGNAGIKKLIIKH